MGRGGVAGEESMKTVRGTRPGGEYAAAALAVAERAPGDERFRRLLGGYCWAHIGNVRRVRPSPNGFKPADAAFAKSAELWLAGAGGDPHASSIRGRCGAWRHRCEETRATIRSGPPEFEEPSK